MAVTATLYGKGLLHALSDVDWTADTIKVALCASGYTPDQDAHEFFSSVTNELATANGYTAGGATLGSKTLTYDAATNQVRLDAADVSWTASGTLTAAKAVVYKSTGSAATSPVLGWVDFGGNVSATDAAFTITWDSTGVLRAAAA